MVAELFAQARHDVPNRSGRVEGGDEDTRAHRSKLLAPVFSRRHATDRALVFDPDIESLFRRQAKAALRKRARALRNSIPVTALGARSEKIVERVIACEPFERARSVALYWPMIERGEVDVRAIDEAARQAGKRVAYPFLRDDADMALLVAEPGSLEERGHGFAEPPERAPEITTNDELVVIVPALAVDTRGHRIGYGKGFYDRLLVRICPPAFAVAVVYDFEVVSEVPADTHDHAVDLVVTDLRSWPIAGA
jgi:5-formyltetrahydrofolate cyclo-ligase